LEDIPDGILPNKAQVQLVPLLGMQVFPGNLVLWLGFEVGVY